MGKKTSHKTKQDWLLFPVNKNQDFSFYVFSSLIPQLCLSGMWYSKLCHTSCLRELFLLRNTPIQANEIASAFLLLKLVHSCIARLQMWYLCFCVMFSLLLHYFFCDCWNPVQLNILTYSLEWCLFQNYGIENSLHLIITLTTGCWRSKD